MPMVPQAVILRNEPVQLGRDPGLQEVEHLLEVFALQVCGVAQVAETQPQIVQRRTSSVISPS
jgi:hypothetical protein